MAIVAKHGEKLWQIADSFMNFYKKKLRLILQNISAQKNRSTQTIRAQHRSIQDLGSCGELGKRNAFKLTAIETDERCLNQDIIDLTNRKEGVDGEHTRTPHMSDSGKV